MHLKLVHFMVCILVYFKKADDSSQNQSPQIQFIQYTLCARHFTECVSLFKICFHGMIIPRWGNQSSDGNWQLSKKKYGLSSGPDDSRTWATSGWLPWIPYPSVFSCSLMSSKRYPRVVPGFWSLNQKSCYNYASLCWPWNPPLVEDVTEVTSAAWRV